MSAAARALKLATLLRAHGAPLDTSPAAVDAAGLAWIAASPVATDTLTTWVHRMVGQPDDARAATLAGALLAAGVPAPALDPRTLVLLSHHDDLADTVARWAAMIAEYHRVGAADVGPARPPSNRS